jgi:hypothetical protein
VSVITHIHIYIYIYKHTYIHIHTYIHTYIYIYTHTLTCAHSTQGQQKDATQEGTMFSRQPKKGDDQVSVGMPMTSKF